MPCCTMLLCHVNRKLSAIVVDGTGYAAECTRLREAYGVAYRKYFEERLWVHKQSESLSRDFWVCLHSSSGFIE